MPGKVRDAEQTQPILAAEGGAFVGGHRRLQGSAHRSGAIELLLRPIHVIRSGLTRLGRGEFGVTLDLPPGDEFSELGTFFNTVSRQLSEDRSQLADQKAAYDRFFHHILPEWVASADVDHEYWPSSPSSGVPFENPNGGASGDTLRGDWTTADGLRSGTFRAIRTLP